MARPKSDIDVRILHAARARFLSDGVDGASLRKIAADAKTNIGMIYYYFPTKDALFLAVVEEVYEKLLVDLEQTLAHDVPVRDRLERVYERIGRLDEDELTVIRLIFREILVSSTRREYLVERFKRGHIPLMLALLGDGIQDGSVRGDESPAVLLLCSLSVGVVPQLILRLAEKNLGFPNVPKGKALAHHLAGILFAGIGAKDNARP